MKICLFKLMISLLLSFILATSSASVLQPTIVKSPLSAQPTLPKLSKPVYRNTELERLIAKEKTSTELSFWNKHLRYKDAEIVAYYALYINRVSIIESFVITE